MREWKHTAVEAARIMYAFSFLEIWQMRGCFKVMVGNKAHLLHAPQPVDSTNSKKRNFRKLFNKPLRNAEKKEFGTASLRKILGFVEKQSQRDLI